MGGCDGSNGVAVHGFSKSDTLQVGSTCMAWSSPDRGFAEVHMTTEAPSIPW